MPDEAPVTAARRPLRSTTSATGDCAPKAVVMRFLSWC
jgi:hypothetical protein